MRDVFAGPFLETWSYRQNDGRMERGTRWRDDRGEVRVLMSFTSGLALGVVYERAGVKYQLGDRRFFRDFSRVPFIEATEDHPAIYRDGSRLVAGKGVSKRSGQRSPKEETE